MLGKNWALYQGTTLVGPIPKRKKWALAPATAHPERKHRPHAIPRSRPEWNRFHHSPFFIYNSQVCASPGLAATFAGTLFPETVRAHLSISFPTPYLL
jgi:hypothetical protein